MNMNSQQKELFRLALLRALHANQTRFGLSAEALRHLVSPFGFHRLDARETERELLYLEDKGLIVELAKTVSPENRV